MNILGISGGIKIGNQDGAAALLVDGRLVAAAEEERFLGIKFANGLLPKNATRFCLDLAGLDIRDLDAVVFAGATYDRFEEILTGFFEMNFGHAPPIRLVDHHRAHAASTYYGSGLDESLVLTMDFSGDRKSTCVYRGSGGELEVLEEIEKPNSLGIFYSAVTQYLGFQRDSDEYKVMGMAAYAEPTLDLSNILEITETGYRFQHKWIRGICKDQPSPSKQEPLFEALPLPVPPRVPGTPMLPEHFEIAASAQHQLEEAVLQTVRYHLPRSEMKHLCVAGGVGLNCLMNQRLRESGLIESLYAPPICSDAGLALGGAYLAAHAQGDKVQPLDHAYWGPEFSAAEIRQILDRAGSQYLESSDPVGAAVQRIAAGHIVGWFQGRMEYGPRALGSRSILASPREAEMKDTINAKVKFREEFRPLAPSLNHEDGARYFVNYTRSPYMTQTFAATEHAKQNVPAIVHADGTSRLQTVDPRYNPNYAKLIRQVGDATGEPIVLNTSLNAYNDPMACQPQQALRTFYATGLDCLVLGPFVLDKPSVKV